MLRREFRDDHLKDVHTIVEMWMAFQQGAEACDRGHFEPIVVADSLWVFGNLCCLEIGECLQNGQKFFIGLEERLLMRAHLDDILAQLDV